MLLFAGTGLIIKPAFNGLITPSLTVGLLPQRPTAYCLLLTAYCSLLTAYCSLPTWHDRCFFSWIIPGAALEAYERSTRRGLILTRFRTEEAMRKALASLLMILTLMFSLAPIGSAQTTRHRHRHGRTFWQKHRDKLTVGATTAAGAGIGAIAGGGKGAAIGAGAGAGSGALYTYKLRKRHRHRRRY